MDINVDTIKELIESLGASPFDKLHLETKDFKLAVERTVTAAQNTVQSNASSGTQVVVQPAVDKSEKKSEEVCGNIVKSPIVGTFYSASSPDKPPFVKPGQKVKNGDTLFIVESMKLMNEITSEYDGAVAEIYVKDGQALEYGQPIMRIE